MNTNRAVNVKLDPNVLVQEVDNEAVLLNLSNEHYFGLDDIGLRFWQLLGEHKNSNEVIQTIKSEYDVSEARLHADLGKFIVELENAGLLTIVQEK